MPVCREVNGRRDREAHGRLEMAFDREWECARVARREGNLDLAFQHLERAHILGQRLTWRHVRSHVGMLRIGWLRSDAGEILGQVLRILAAAMVSRIWVPAGNTGGANVSAIQPMPVPPDLQGLLDAERP